jgi:hypothetical protein
VREIQDQNEFFLLRLVKMDYKILNKYVSLKFSHNSGDGHSLRNCDTVECNDQFGRRRKLKGALLKDAPRFRHVNLQSPTARRSASATSSLFLICLVLASCCSVRGARRQSGAADEMLCGQASLSIAIAPHTQLEPI